MRFQRYIKKVADSFKPEIVRLISHLDADGICSAAIMVNTLNNLGIKYVLSIIKQLDEDLVVEYAKEDYTTYIFTDLGSGQIDIIKEHLGKKQIFILDHHSYDTKLDIPDNINMINPHRYGIDGSMDISGSGIVYLFSEALDEKNKEMSYLAVIGAIGDIQEKNGFTGLNKKILETAVKEKKIKVVTGIRWFGIETRPLHYLLTYNNDPIVPNVTGSESKAIQFLQDIGIPPKIKNQWTRYNDLTKSEQQSFISSIIIKRAGEQKPEDIFGQRYILLDEPKSEPTRDAREFATLLNACGRMNKASIGIGACLNNPKFKKKAIATLGEYRKEIIAALRWYENHASITKGNKYIIINAKNKIRSTIIGTLASIISNSADLKKGTIILALARDRNKTKVSIRVAGSSKYDLRDIIRKIAQNGEAGGHKNAAGAIILTKYEKEFLNDAVKVLNSLE